MLEWGVGCTARTLYCTGTQTPRALAPMPPARSGFVRVIRHAPMHDTKSDKANGESHSLEPVLCYANSREIQYTFVGCRRAVDGRPVRGAEPGRASPEPRYTDSASQARLVRHAQCSQQWTDKRYDTPRDRTQTPHGDSRSHTGTGRGPHLHTHSSQERTQRHAPLCWKYSF